MESESIYELMATPEREEQKPRRGKEEAITEKDRPSTVRTELEIPPRRNALHLPDDVAEYLPTPDANQDQAYETS